jgi:hypothetical protein
MTGAAIARRLKNQGVSRAVVRGEKIASDRKLNLIET